MATARVEDVIDRVLRKIDDGIDTDDDFDSSDGFDADDVLEALNSCNVEIATRLDIKDLAAVTELTLEADSDSTALPNDFCKKLSAAYNTTNNEHLRIFDSRRLIDRRISQPGTSGHLYYGCQDGTNFYYQYMPSAETTVEIYYYALPDDLTDPGTFPSYIPYNFARKLFYHYALKELYDEIEDGEEGEKVNTLYHDDKFEKVLNEYKLFMGPDPDLPHAVNYFNNRFDFSDF